MELRQLRYVLAVADTRSFTGAAAQCFVVQSVLSHQVAALERELGVALFARTSRRVEMTASGEAFLPAARACLEAAERAVADAAAAVGLIRGHLTLGVIPTVTAIDVPATIGRFHLEHPEVRVSLCGGTSDELVTGVRTGRVDVAVLGVPESRTPRGVSFRVLARELLVAVVGPAHGLATRESVELSDLAAETFVDFPAGTPGRVQSDLAFAGAGLRREVAFEAMAADHITGLVRQHVAVALLPQGLAARQSDLVAIPVVEGPARLQCVAWSEFNPSPAALAFLDVLQAA